MPDRKVAQAYYLPAELIRWVNAWSEVEKRSRSWVVEQALTRYRKDVEAVQRDADPA
jgi:predicted transcriptional regulator